MRICFKNIFFYENKKFFYVFKKIFHNIYLLPVEPNPPVPLCVDESSFVISNLH